MFEITTLKTTPALHFLATANDAPRNGMMLNAMAQPYEKALPEIQIRINAERCSVRFLTDTISAMTQRPQLVTTFAQTASPDDADLSAHGNVHIGVEVEADGFVRVAANRINEN